ncbi:MAG: sel1 repeat family protein [Desulfarculaceae bacterium]|nr:sel1 repeat family protein [Desulfarculaceae bacterium]MCF8072050.1 sel1 repeat family protein [Desulfarculaceae bacterium]MCF8101567.1 sel1 repeat family protein [Desulfarculaceae bacterium]MCF8115117.1 sel1 repeat family protein [Desulfarculaceae bacterium]
MIHKLSKLTALAGAAALVLCLSLGPALAASTESNGDDELVGKPKIPASEAQPFATLRTRAEAGDPKAQFQVGKAYIRGVEVGQHFTKARQWFLRSANQGYAPAMLEAAEMYVNGRGGDKDQVRAYYWYLLAAANGISSAVPRRNRLLERIEPKEAEKAQDQAADFKPRLERGAKP